MKQTVNSLFLISGVIFLLWSCSRTDVQYWDNGNMKSEINYKNGKIDGKATWYYEDGSKYYEAIYVEEKLEGDLITWYSNGHLQSKEHYTSDKLNGKSVFYNSKGRKTEEISYVEDIKHGEYRAWYDDRKIRIEGMYDEGMMTGKWFYWDGMGTLIGEGQFHEGSGIQKKYSPNGSLIGKLTYRNNEKHGKELYYNAKGEIIKEVLYDEGEFIRETNIEAPN